MEERRIGATVSKLRTALGEAEIVVVDDGSVDRTAAVAGEAAADVVVRLPANRGKGAAVRAGVQAAGGRAIAFTDADLSYRPAQILRLVAEVESGADVVVGSRRHVDTTTLVRAGRLREIGGRVFNVMTRAVLSGRYGDTQCGLKAFSRQAAGSIFARTRIDGFAFDVEVLLIAERLGLSVREVGVELDPARGSTVTLNSAARMVADLVKLRRWARAGVYDPGERDHGGASRIA